MARRKQSPAEDLIDIVSTLPWWAGILLAGISYTLLHLYVINTSPQFSGQELSTVIQGNILHTLSNIGQYLLPILFGFGALISAVKGFQRKKLHGDVTSGAKLLEDVSWQQFEILIGEHFRQQGFKVTETDTGPDGGVDLILYRVGQKYLVQCKHWKTSKVGVKPVRELMGVIASQRAAGGYFVASGAYTTEAVKFGRENKIELIDGKTLRKILSNRGKEQVAKPEIIKVEEIPVCPKCGSEMVLRTAKKGSKIGEQFWGCSRFPKCKSTI